MMDDNGMGSMVDMYVYEENQLLDKLEDIMLETEKDGDLSSDNINEIFRIMHTIKGSSAMMSYNNISTLAHSVEDLFYFIREQHPTGLDISAICDLVLSASDFIKAEIEKVEGGSTPDGDASDIEQNIKDHLAKISGKAAGSAQAAPAAPSAPKAASSAEAAPSVTVSPEAPSPSDEAEGNAYVAHVIFDEGGKMENLRAFAITRNLSECAGKIKTNPPDLINTPAETILQNGFDIYFVSAQPEERIRSLFDEALFLKSYDLSPAAPEENASFMGGTGAAKEAGASRPAAEAPSAASAAPQHVRDDRLAQNGRPSAEPPKAPRLNLISVNVAKLDSLMNLVGELVISESMVTKNPELKGLELPNFHKAARQLRKLTDELQDIVMSVRMVPIGGTFHKMQRIVRDMSHKLNKEVEFVTEGEDTEVDKNIIDHLNDPLMHLIRNSMDHGVESEDVRVKAGKPKKGRVTLSARNTGGDVKISVADDGAGLNKEKILKKAAENGLLTKPAEEMTDREIYSLILLPGFSTNEKVTEYSGRGVGMDVVKRNLEEVGGSIAIQSIEGEGTTMIITIPLTLAIADAMELSVGGNVYTLPTVSIRESFRPKKEDILYDNDNNEMILIRGDVYPIIRLHKLFGIDPKCTDLDKGILIMIEGENKAACIFADELIGEQQVVVKPLPQYLVKCDMKTAGIEGCTILGDGSISLILNAKGLIERVIG